MNIANLVLTRVTSPTPDWIIKADIIDDKGKLLGTFGPKGTSVNTWWNQQTEEFQREYVSIFMSIMATQMVIQ